jgi:phosphoesterase RecJ-like protein
VYLYNRDPVPDMLTFLPGTDEIQAALPSDRIFDATLITDTAARNLLPRQMPPSSVAGPTVIIDHHVGHDDFGDVVVRDTSACATAMVVLALASELNVKPVPTDAALPLYTAIVADTGGFRYSGTTPDTLRTAADLMDAGIDPWRVASHVFERWPMSRMRLLGKAINAIETEFAGRVAVLCVTLSMIEQAGANERMVEGMVEYGRMLDGVEISMMLWERRARPDEGADRGTVTRLSLRSAGAIDVATIAAAVGGGGHRSAAGATLDCEMRVAREQVLAEVGKALGVGNL